MAAIAMPPPEMAVAHPRRWAPREVAFSAPHTPTATTATATAPPPVPVAKRPARISKAPSFVVQHYHSTGCVGGAFSWRAAMMDPQKEMRACTEEREYRDTTMADITRSKEDKQRGGGPRVGPFQPCIPGCGWQALPKYDFSTSKRSSAFNERMHVEWENHADHILKNNGELPPVSVVAKAGFRSCAPCCRDMLALAQPTGKAFVMVDLAEDDQRGTFHFVAGGEYLPVPKEGCNPEELQALKDIVARAQAHEFQSSEELLNAVRGVGPAVDEAARQLYLRDAALLPHGCAEQLKGSDLLEVLHAEHFARLSAEYGASILRDGDRPLAQREAIMRCRAIAKANLRKAWAPHLAGVKVDLVAYIEAATSPLLPEDPLEYQQHRRSLRAPGSSGSAIGLAAQTPMLSGKSRSAGSKWRKGTKTEDDRASIVATTVPDESLSEFSEESEDPAEF